MFRTTSIRARIMLLGIVAFLAVCITAGVGLRAMMRSNAGLENAIIATASVLHQKQADMMHDALRADVLGAILAGMLGTADEKSAITADLNVHVAEFRASIASLQALALPDEIRIQVEKVVPVLDEYIAAAEQIVPDALRDPVAGRAESPAFTAAFSHLATEMGALGDLIESRNAETARAAQQGNNTLILVQIAVSVVVAVLMALGGWWVTRSITASITRLRLGIRAVANGNFDLNLASVTSHDEVGEIAVDIDRISERVTRALAEQTGLQEASQRVIRILGGGMEQLSAGNLTMQIDEPFGAEYDSLRLDFNATRQNLASAIAQVVEASHTIRVRSTEISTASEDLSRRTENQAAALEETATALDELTASVKSAADGAHEVENIVRAARKGAEDSGVVVQATVAAMAEIEKSSEQISQIIGAIDDIAFQTNLLALIAGVEAARAGDAGRGFAVVASEVRALAQRSSAAAKEIKTLIAAAAKHVGRGVDQVGKVGEALNSIVGSVANISTLMTSMAAGAAVQSTGLAEINTSVTQLDQVTQQNAAMVEESSAASHALHQEVAGLAELVAKFRIPSSEGNLDRDIPLSQFVPTDFAGPQTFDEEPMTPQAVRPAKSANMSANASATAIWQDF